MAASPSPSGELTLGHVLGAAGVTELANVLVVRHAYRADGITAPEDVTDAKVLAYTPANRTPARRSSPKHPPPLWLAFMADGKWRSRFLIAFDNHGEIAEERTDVLRHFDLRPSGLLSALRKRLVIGWSRDAINWAKSGSVAATFPVVEIADPTSVPFPGFEHLLISHGELETVVTDSRYAGWRTALGAVQGIYLIADRSTGQLYVGKADGGERILGRWSAYARDGHGGNVALRELTATDLTRRRHFMFSTLRVFSPSATTAEVDEAESHFKRALLTRQFGLNRN